MIDFLSGTKDNIPPSRLHLEDWRPIFYKGQTGDTSSAKKKAFQRVRESIDKTGLLKSQAIIIQYRTVGHKRDICNFVPVGPFSVAGHFVYAYKWACEGYSEIAWNIGSLEI